MQIVASAALVAALAAGAQAQSGPSVTTPTSLVECQPAQFSVSGGSAPYIITIIPGGEVSAAPLETLPTQDAAGSVTWNVDIASGTAISIQVRDATGALNYSQQVTIQAGTSTSCVGKNSASAAAGGGASSSAAAGGATSTAAADTSAHTSATSSAAGGASSARSTGGSATSAAGGAASSATSAAASATGSSPAGKVVVTGAYGLAAAIFAALFA